MIIDLWSPHRFVSKALDVLKGLIQVNSYNLNHANNDPYNV